MASEETELSQERLSRTDTVLEVLRGIGVASGLAMLWGMELVRNTLFRALDRFNRKPYPRRGTAFPPGQPRRKAVRQVRA